MSFNFSPESNLQLQIVTVALVIAAFFFSRQKKFLVHGTLMLAAVLLNAASLILKMVPSILNLAEVAGYYPLSLTVVTAVHGFLGAVTETLGAWFVVSWGVRRSTQKCFGKKSLMRITLVLWVATFLVGVLVYYLWYTYPYPFPY